jgi:hypothetical protein
MARIPEAEIERLKREVSLMRLIESQGHKLQKRGKDSGGDNNAHARDSKNPQPLLLASALAARLGAAGRSALQSENRVGEKFRPRNHVYRMGVSGFLCK